LTCPLCCRYSQPIVPLALPERVHERSSQLHEFHDPHDSRHTQSLEMPSLVIPDTGLSLDSAHHAAKHAPSVANIYGLTLSDDVIDQMIKCVQNGKEIQLSLGQHPVSFQFTVGNFLQAVAEPMVAIVGRKHNTRRRQ